MAKFFLDTHSSTGQFPNFKLKADFDWLWLSGKDENKHIWMSIFNFVPASRNELISDVLLWTPTHGRAKAARTYIQQLCEDTGCCPEDLPEAMNDREKWRERVRDIRATSTTWWWWWWWYSTCLLLNGAFLSWQHRKLNKKSGYFFSK